MGTGIVKRLAYRGLAIGMTALFILASGEGSAQTKSRALFGEEPGQSAAAAAGRAGGTGRHHEIRGHRVKVDLSAVAGVDTPDGAEAVELNLFPDVTLTATKSHFERRDGARFTWSGKVSDDPLSMVVLVGGEGPTYGSVFAHGKHYAIRGTDAASQEVVEIDQSAFPPEACDQFTAGVPVQTAPTAQTAAPSQGSLADTGSTIDVMVVYTPAASSAEGGTAAITSMINLAVAETNTSYANSGITPRLNLVHAEEVAYTESGNWSTDLNRLIATNDTYMDNVHSLRNSYGADVVVLLINDQKYCGLAADIMATASTAFALVQYGCATGLYSFGHEIGHLQGARHDRYVDTNNGWLDPLTPPSLPGLTYNHGDVDVASGQRTVMAYNNECAAQGVYCTRLPNWSTPGVLYPSTSTPMGSTTYENNVQVLNDTAYTVANFKQAIVVPVTLTVQSTYPTAGVLVTASPVDRNGTSSGTTTFTLTYNKNTSVTLTAPLTAPATGDPFAAWANCTSTSGTSGRSCTVSMTGAKTVVASYTPANYLPTLDAIANLTINEDAGLQTVPLSGISAGPPSESAQILSVTATSSNPGLIPDPPTFIYTPGDALTFTPVANAYGTATITVTVKDNGGGPYDTVVRSFVVTVNAVNDAPSFVKTVNPAVADPTVLEDAGAQTVTGWATSISAGPSNETTQTLSFTTTNNNTGLFSVQPAVVANGTLTFTPAANANGSALVTVRLHDNGGTANGGVDTSDPQTFTITVTAVNDAPSFVKGANKVVLEDAAAQTVTGWATGVKVGPANESAQTLTFTTTNNTNAALFSAQPAVAVNGTLTFTPAANTSGSATVTVQLSDDGGTANGGVDTSAAQSFTITVSAVNDAPTLDAIAPLTINEDSGLRTVNLSGIGAGGGESQPLTVTAVSSNTLVIPHPTVSYSSPSGTGSLSFTPVANAYGAATITVTVKDGQLVNGSAVQTFVVTVTPVNDPPTLNAIADVALKENAGLRTVALSGITAGPKESQALTVTASSDATALIPNPTVIYASPSATGSLRFTPVANAYGTATITVTVKDTGGGANTVSRSFVVTVNNLPTLNAIVSRTINEDAGLQTVNLSGIGAGLGESQTLTVTAVSSNTGLIPNPAVTYTSTDATGSLGFTPVANAYGAATITVTVNDGQTANNTVVRTFTVTVNSANDAPSFVKGADQTVLEDAGAQKVIGWATGISAGPANESTQTLVFTTTNNKTALFSVQPALTANGTLTFTPAVNASGFATVTVKLRDNGGTANGGVDTSGTQTFTITVTAVNDAPTLSAIPNRTISEDAVLQTVALSGIAAGGGESQTLTVTAASSNTGLIPNPTVVYTTPSTVGSLKFTPVANANGTATITVTVDDGQLANNTFSRSFVVTVNAVNDAPSFVKAADPLVAGPTVLEDAGAQTVTGWATGVSAGPANESAQTLSFMTTNNNAGLFSVQPSVAVDGTLSFTPASNVSGKATVSVRLHDSGGIAAGGVDTSGTQTFTITVTPVNDPPTLNAIANVSVNMNSGLRVVALGGITAGPRESQALKVTASSSDTAVIPNPVVIYTSPGATGSLRFTPVANASGAATITVTVDDSQPTDNTVAKAFLVTVVAPTAAGVPVALMDAPPAKVSALNASFVGIVNSLAAENPSGPAPLEVTFDAAGSAGPSPIVSYHWDFGDGQVSDTAAATVAHSYTSTGSSLATLTVTDSSGGTDSTQRIVSVADAIQTATTAAEFQASLEIAKANGKHDIIRLAGGTYPISANAGDHFAYSSAEDKDLVIEGGWTPDFSQRAANISTELKNDDPVALAESGGVLEITSGGNVGLAGIAISGGKTAGSGGGLFIRAVGSIAVGNSQILDNAAGGDGGGLFLESTGGGIRLSGSTINGNSGASGGGGVVKALSASVYSNEISGNMAAATDGGLQASVISGGSLVVSNNTISGNQAPAGSSGLSVAATGTRGMSVLDVYNNIVYGNGAATNFVVAPDTDCVMNFLDLNIVNNDIACYEMCPEYLLDGSNISVDFSGRGAGSIRLLATDTALIDHGSPYTAPLEDIEGDAIPLDGHTATGAVPDIGADEYNPGNTAGPSSMTVSASGNITAAGGSATITVTLDKPAKRDLVLYLSSGDAGVVTLTTPYLKIFRGLSSARTVVQAASGARNGFATITATDPSGRIDPGGVIVTLAVVE